MSIFIMAYRYFWYRKHGIGMRDSLSNLNVRFNAIDYAMLIILVVCAITLAYKIYQTNSNYEQVSARYDMAKLSQKIKTQHESIDKLEKIAIACLTGDAVRLEGIDRPCKIGEYRDGKERF